MGFFVPLEGGGDVVPIFFMLESVLGGIAEGGDMVPENDIWTCLPGFVMRIDCFAVLISSACLGPKSSTPTSSPPIPTRAYTSEPLIPKVESGVVMLNPSGLASTSLPVIALKVPIENLKRRFDSTSSNTYMSIEALLDSPSMSCVSSLKRMVISALALVLILSLTKIV